ncbi:diacylglycerol/lipid kinase family protein [Nocardia bovistercoris]|uniref:NAD(+)/NADH kinase n=1 Tax=Nocardia bovistercoris TaxID=2785916 RepID=A0A931IEB6_9NOCA|nr:diacylglycerol kinase family protein [Nocardia bovistercoris]MBH0779904.1 NAD(+)/NADH kinase [Nocardia bovistercoris]
MSGQAPDRTGMRRWAARAAFGFAGAAALAPVLFAGLLGTVGLFIVGAGGAVVTVAALYWFLTRRGAARIAALVLALLAPLVVFALFVRANLLWVVLLSCGLAALAVLCARTALREDETIAMPEYPTARPRHPFLIMNPHSGGGKVGRFDLRRKAEDRGAEVLLLEGPGTVDVVAAARDAVARGADLLGVAGGDGTQALVAGVAADSDVPFLVISAGTRNHFAMDLGLDRADPAASLDALDDGVELRIDIGAVNDRPFVNNVSFGVYAEVVRSPAYRDDKTATVLEMLPDLLAGDKGSRLVAHIGDTVVDGPQAVLVSNNPYGSGDLAGLSRRERLDRGLLGAVAVSVANAREALDLLRIGRFRQLVRLGAGEVVVEAEAKDIPVGVDGESLMLSTPVRCVIRPGALRVRVPRTRPGVRPTAPAMNWTRLRDKARRPRTA